MITETILYSSKHLTAESQFKNFLYSRFSFGHPFAPSEERIKELVVQTHNPEKHGAYFNYTISEEIISEEEQTFYYKSYVDFLYNYITEEDKTQEKKEEKRAYEEQLEKLTKEVKSSQKQNRKKSWFDWLYTIEKDEEHTISWETFQTMRRLERAIHNLSEYINKPCLEYKAQTRTIKYFVHLHFYEKK